MLGSVGRLSNPARNQRVRHLPTATTHKPPATAMLSERRSSAAGIVPNTGDHRRPSLLVASAIAGHRSLSLDDALLDADKDAMSVAALAGCDIEGASENQIEPHTILALPIQAALETTTTPPKPIPRRSRSSENLLDSQSCAAHVHHDHSEQPSCLASSSDDDHGAVECPRDHESIIVHVARLRQHSEPPNLQQPLSGIHNSMASSGGYGANDDDENAAAKTSTAPRTLLNRYVSKVRSLIRK